MTDITSDAQSLSLQRYFFLLQALQKDVDAKIDENIPESVSQPMDFAAAPEPYTVVREAAADSAALDTMNKLAHFEETIASKYNMKPLDDNTIGRMLKLRDEIDKTPSNTELSKEYQQLERRGLDEKTFSQYVAELQQKSVSLSSPAARTFQVGITPDVFRTMGGSPGYREGGWADGHLFPASMRSDYMEHGLVVQATRGGDIASKLSMQKIFGPDRKSVV